MGIFSSIFTKRLFIHCIQIELLMFVEGGKPESTREKPLGAE